MRSCSGNHSQLAAGLLAGLVLLGTGCLHPVSPETGVLRYFERPDPYDAWSLKIAQWQSSQSAAAQATPKQEAGENLRSRYFRRRTELRRGLAQDIAAWIQEEAKLRYAADTTIDHWPTLEEVLAANGDDCDGLELLVHRLLLDLGFPANEVYRAVVHRASDDRYHMVTLWFEAPDDPWVIDPTGAMVLGMPHMSEVPDWLPLKLFSATEEYTVRQAAGQ